MSFKLNVLGCGSAIPDLKNNQTSQLLNINERFFLIDCGESTQIQLKKYNFNLQRISHIFISHLHGDHYFGLIGLISSMHLLGRNKELHVYAHEPLKDIINLQLEVSEIELNFPLFFHPISKEETVLFEDDNIVVRNIILDHRIMCSGFIFKEKKSKRKFKKGIIEKLNIPFNKIDSIKNGADWIDCSGNVIKNNFLTIANNLPFSYAFCTDTRFNESIIEKLKNIDLLYYETTFKKDMQERAQVTGHSTTLDASKIAKKSNVGMLMIGHFSKRYNNLDDLLSEVKEKFPRSILAYPGLCINFQDLRK